MKRSFTIPVFLAAAFILATYLPVKAVPSFARQTNMACNACHNIPPQLTTFGRIFKLNGYNITGTANIESKDKSGRTVLELLALSPLSIMFQASFTHLNATLPGTQNDNVEFPQQLSLFYSGKITPHLGTFIQVTYEAPSGTFGLDNTDIRYARHGQLFKKDLVYGITLNNNPTVQDPWNSTPAWGFPFASSATAPAPDFATMIEEGLAQEVAGLGLYAFFNNLLYAEFDAYRTAQLGAPNPPDTTSSMVIKGVSPYWRVSLQKQMGRHYLEIGTYGLSTNLYPVGISGLTNKYLDIAFDLQYEYMMNNGNFTLHSTYINEKQTLDAAFADELSEKNSLKLNTFKIDGTIFFQKGYAASLAYFNVNGDQDALMYGGFSKLKPNSDGFIAEVDFLPWFNTRFSLQYVMYNQFDGAKSDYDGTGRSASDNNTFYVLFWLNF
jgi:hypothetical protein